jgi:hypothetical protein
LLTASLARLHIERHSHAKKTLQRELFSGSRRIGQSVAGASLGGLPQPDVAQLDLHAFNLEAH